MESLFKFFFLTYSKRHKRRILLLLLLTGRLTGRRRNSGNRSDEREDCNDGEGELHCEKKNEVIEWRGRRWNY